MKSAKVLSALLISSLLLISATGTAVAQTYTPTKVGTTTAARAPVQHYKTSPYAHANGRQYHARMGGTSGSLHHKATVAAHNLKRKN